MAQLQRESTEFLYIGVKGNPPPESAKIALLPPGIRPEDHHWLTAAVVTPEHELWQEAIKSPIQNVDYYIAILIGPFVVPETPAYHTTLEPGDYQVWLMFLAGVERPVRIAPAALEVL